MNATMRARSAKRVSISVMIAAPLLLAGLTTDARAGDVIGTFSTTAGTPTSVNFVDAAGFPYAEGDSITGSFTFDPNNFLSTFSAIIVDQTTGQTFTMPAGAAISGSATIPSSTSYDVMAEDSITTDPHQEDQTQFFATLTLDLAGSGLTSDLTQTALLSGGTGSLVINIPPEGPYVAESLSVPFTDVSASIPEPVSMSLLGAGLAALTAVRRRAKR